MRIESTSSMTRGADRRSGFRRSLKAKARHRLCQHRLYRATRGSLPQVQIATPRPILVSRNRIITRFGWCGCGRPLVAWSGGHCPLHTCLNAVAAPLPRRRQYAAQHGEVLRPLRRAEPARDYHGRSHRPQVPPLQVVREEHPGIVREAQHLNLEGPEARCQVVSRSPLLAPVLFRTHRPQQLRPLVTAVRRLE